MGRVSWNKFLIFVCFNNAASERNTCLWQSTVLANLQHLQFVVFTQSKLVELDDARQTIHLCLIITRQLQDKYRSPTFYDVKTKWQRLPSRLSTQDHIIIVAGCGLGIDNIFLKLTDILISIHTENERQTRGENGIYKTIHEVQLCHWTENETAPPRWRYTSCEQRERVNGLSSVLNDCV